MTLIVSALDKDNVSSDLVGRREIDLVEEMMLLPVEEVKQKTFTLLYEKESAGVVKIDYQFNVTPFNF